MSTVRNISWEQDGQLVVLPVVSENKFSLPKKIRLAEEDLSVEDFLHFASDGGAFIWRGDFHACKLLLQAIARRIDKRSDKRSDEQTGANNKAGASASITDLFHKHRHAQAAKARLLSRLLIRIEGDRSISLARAPDVSQALNEALPEVSGSFVISMRELQGVVGAHEWRKKGLAFDGFAHRVHPHYGVFAPIRSEYLDLVRRAPLPSSAHFAIDVGTGTGVLALLLASRSVPRVLATDIDPRANACAKENVNRFGLTDQVDVQLADLFKQELPLADLIVCNPPWLPGTPTSSMERAIYDPSSNLLKAFLARAAARLNPGGEIWLILSNFAELLGLREKNVIEKLITEEGLFVLEKSDTPAQHRKAQDTSDPLHAARALEVTSLRRLKKRP